LNLELTQGNPHSFKLTFQSDKSDGEGNNDEVLFISEAAMKKSTFFKVFCTGGQRFKEVEDRTVNFPEENPKIMRHIVRYLEHEKIHNTIRNSTADSFTFADVFKAADMYDAGNLKVEVAARIMAIKKSSFIKTIKVAFLISQSGLIEDEALQGFTGKRMQRLLVNMSNSQAKTLKRMLALRNHAFTELIVDSWEMAYHNRNDRCSKITNEWDSWKDDYNSLRQAWRKRKRVTARQSKEILIWHKLLTEKEAEVQSLTKKVASLKKAGSRVKTSGSSKNTSSSATPGPGNLVAIPQEIVDLRALPSPARAGGNSVSVTDGRGENDPDLSCYPNTYRHITKVSADERGEDSQDLAQTPEQINDIRDDSSEASGGIDGMDADNDDTRISRDARMQKREVGPGSPLHFVTDEEDFGDSSDPSEYRNGIDDENLEEAALADKNMGNGGDADFGGEDSEDEFVEETVQHDENGEDDGDSWDGDDEDNDSEENSDDDSEDDDDDEF
jgi:hypothetical protein